MSVTRLSLAAGEVNLEHRAMERGGETVRLTPTEARLLSYLASRPGQIFTEEFLLLEIWPDRPSDVRTFSLTLERLRQKIELDPSKPNHLISKDGGYAFASDKPHPPVDALVGPAELVTRVLALFQREVPLVTLVGPPGAGKSHLARQVSAAWESHGQTVLVELEGLEIASEASVRIAGALGMQGAASEALQLERALAGRAPMLLVLDQLEQLIPVLDRIALLVGTPGVSVLATSRVPLGLEGERVVQIEPLSVADTARLFLALAREANAREEVLAERSMERAYAVTGGLPLAVVLAAAWLATMRPATMGAAFQSLQPLEAEFTEGRLSVQRAFEVCAMRSWEAMEEGDLLALRLLCVVPGPLPLDAFEAVVRSGSSDRPLERLDRLTRRAWISRDAASRVIILAPLRAFVGARTSAGVTRTALKRLFAWAAPLVRRLRSRLEVTGHAEALAQLERDLPMLWELARRSEPGVLRARLICDLAQVAQVVGTSPSTAARLDEAIVEAGEDRGLVAAARLRRATLSQQEGQDAREELRAALEIAVAAGDQALVVEARTRLGLGLRRRGALDEAATLLSQALQEAAALPRLAALAEIELAAVDCVVTSWWAALPRLQSAEAKAISLGNHHLEMLAAGSLATCEQELRRWPESEAAMRRALEAAKALNAQVNAAFLQSNLAALYTFDVQRSFPGRVKDAVELLDAARACYRRHGMLLAEAHALQGLAYAHLALARPEVASRMVIDAITAFHATGHALGEGISLGLLARLEHHASRPSEALRRYDEGAALLSTVGAKIAQAELQALAVIAAADLGNQARAATLREEAGRTLVDGPKAHELLKLADVALSARSHPESERLWAQLRARLASIDLDRLG